MSAILEFLARKLSGGRLEVGQVVCTGAFVLTHRSDEGRGGLTVWTDPEEAAALARYDDHGEFRPLKSAPNLRTGWELRLNALSDVRLALDHFYPAALGNALALERGERIWTDLLEMLGRQTGMYAVTRKLTVEEAGPLVATACARTNCSNHILWNLAANQPSPLTVSPAEALKDPVPLVCTEACPLLVGAARKVVKSRQTPPPSPAA